jgi:prolyl-tRNA synthetase
VVKGKKTEEEKFAGGRYTTTVEAFIPANGRGVQGATSHCLGDNFAKMFDIYYETKQGDRRHVIQNSWGLTTRTIGVMMMVHGDNDGLVLPPRVAPTQVMIVPVFYKDEAVCQQIREQCTAFEKALNAAGVRAESDLRTDKNPGFKYNQYELKGIPLRLEVGPGDVTKKQVMAKRRFGDQKKFAVDITDEKAAVARIAAELEAIQADMLAKATADRDARISQVTTWKEFNQELNKLHMVLAPWCGFKQCELKIKKDSAEAANLKVEAQGGPQGSATAGDADGDAEVFEQLTGAAKSLCTPFDQPALEEGTCCVRCDKKAINWTLFGRSY